MPRCGRLTAAELAALPLLARGAALRFLLTRLFDWLDVPPGALVVPKDPLEYYRKLRFHRSVADAQRLRARPHERDQPHVEIWTDGACSGNPGPGGWGAILQFGEHEQGADRRRGGDHQQPHGTDGRDRGARGADRARAVSSSIPTAHTCAAASPAGSMAGRSNGWRTADKKPVKNVDLWQRLDAALRAAHEVALALGQGPRRPRANERADELARDGMVAVRAGIRGALSD